MSRRVLLVLLSAAVLVGLIAQPGAAVNVPQAAVVSANPANWTPHVLDGKVDAVVQVGNKMVAGGLFTKVANAATPTTAIPRSNIFAFDATTGVIDTTFAPVLDGEVESLAVAPDGLHVFAGGSFIKINGVAQKSLVKLRLRDGARITAFKGRTSARVKDRRLQADRHRQLDLCGRPAARPDRHAQPGHQPGDRLQLGDHPLPAAVLHLVRHLHA